MRDNVLQLIFLTSTLVLGAGIEDCLPHVLNVGFPVLLSCVLFVATDLNLTLVPMMIFALAAGGFADALGMRPMAASGSFFLLSAFVARWVRFPLLLASVAYPCYLVWLAVWTGTAGGDLWGRLFVSVPIGLVTVCPVGGILLFVERGAAIGEAS